MSKMKNLEQQLTSWEPRNPSGKVRVSLFGRAPRKPSLVPRLLPLLAPVTACLMALTVLFSSEDNVARTPGLPILFASASSNMTSGLRSEADLTLLNPERKDQHNVWDKATFDWTNEALWTSSNRSFDVTTTNDLR